jgi:hypothetical protein
LISDCGLKTKLAIRGSGIGSRIEFRSGESHVGRRVRIGAHGPDRATPARNLRTVHLAIVRDLTVVVTVYEQASAANAFSIRNPQSEIRKQGF